MRGKALYRDPRRLQGPNKNSTALNSTRMGLFFRVRPRLEAIENSNFKNRGEKELSLNYRTEKKKTCRRSKMVKVAYGPTNRVNQRQNVT